MNNKIDTLLFDLDGTLVNTYDLILESFLYTFRQFGLKDFSHEDCIPFIGPPLWESFESVLPGKSEEMVRVYREYNLKNHDRLIKEYDGVYDTVKALHEKGYKLAVVTTKMRDSATKGLVASRLLDFFPHIIGLEDVKNSKPHPEPIYKALELLNSEPERTIMVGDSYHDILAANNAGTKSVAVSWSIKGMDFLKQFEPDHIIDHMSELLKVAGAE